MKIRHIASTGTNITDKVNNYFQFTKTQFLQYFFDIDEPIEWVHEDEPADVCIYSIQMNDESMLRDNEVNVFFSIENMKYWAYRGNYQFYNTFKWDESKKTNIYIQNDIDRIVRKDTHIIFPTVYFRLNYFKNIKDNYEINIPWEKKHFCLFISQNYLNANKERLVNELATLGPVNHISSFYELLKDKSCYNSKELIKVFGFFKFIICCENSNSTGYVTEKIFNIMLANSIPIYNGAPEIERYINKNRFLKYDNNLIENVKNLMDNEVEYNKVVNAPVINEEFDDENFIEVFKSHLKR
tara:strand:+ start:1621 stop:2514 length:894 start_codon:yes stop_codon:yes gene_type:complete